jgi:F-type H+-transporting ATPase subunit b
MESIISTFHIDWKIIIAQAVNFGIVFVILYLFALKPLNKLMAERSEKIARGINDAKENATLLERSRSEYDAALAKAKAEADKIFEEGKKEAENKRRAMLDEAREEVEKTVENGKRTLEAEKIKMVNDARAEIVTLATRAAEKILGAKIDGNFDDKTIKELNNI